MTRHRIPIDFAAPCIEQRVLTNGGFVWSSREPLADYPAHLGVCLHRWANEAPQRSFLVQRDAHGQWRHLSYRQALSDVRAIAASLLERGIDANRPVMLLSDNSIENAMLVFGCQYAGIPAVPVSPAYSLMSTDLAKVRYVADLVKPSLVFAADGTAFARALGLPELGGAERVIVDNPADGMVITRFSDLTDTSAGARVDQAYGAVNADTVAKILFTSGSTGQPKGVINTQRMMCSNQQAMAQIWPFAAKTPPVIVDWLPWNHTFGGNHNLNMILWRGGTLYIDNGKPAPGLIDKTIANLRDVCATIYFNVPRGFDMLVPYLEQDAPLRDNFFERLELIFYAAAALPQNLWERLENLSLASRAGLVPMTSSWGATETAPAVTAAHFPLRNAGVIGVPIPGTELKFVPNAGKLEMRVRGPQVTPGYYRRPDITAEAFDADGYYLIGDAGKPADVNDPNRGVVFDGRVAEDFKLSSGTWVSVGTIRVDVIAAAGPLIQDAVLAGHDQNEIGLLVFPNLSACAKIAGLPPDATANEIITDPAVRQALAEGLAAYNAKHPATSQRIARALFLKEPPSIDANEITDKGYINQRAVLEARAGLIDVLYSSDDRVLIMNGQLRV